MFDHRQDGVSEQQWLQLPELRAVGALRLLEGADRLVILAAHPDDETLGAGGLMFLAAQQAVATEVIIATDGEASHPHSSTHTPADLARLRQREATAAIAALNPEARVSFLHLPDGQLAEHHDQLALALAARLGDSGAVWLVSTWAGDRHPDHEACSAAARTLRDTRLNVRLFEFPIWAWHWAEPSAVAMPWIDCRTLALSEEALLAKRAALDCYVTQNADLSPLPGDEAIVSAAMAAHFDRDFETFIEVGHRSASSPSYFNDLYANSDDPWGLAEGFYESRKRDVLMASLPRARFRRAFEPGCAIGLLTQHLATRCAELIAWDVSGRAVEQTRERIGKNHRVQVELGYVPQAWPPGLFDLIVLSEVGYYCPDLGALAARVESSLESSGVLIACHWRHSAPDHPHTAEEVHSALGERLKLIVHHREADFALDVWSRAGTSVAQDEAIVA